MKTTKLNILKAMVMPIVLIFTAAIAHAEDGAIRFSNNAFKQVISKAADGSIQYDYVEPKLVLPDDVILYEIKFENISDQEVTNIVIDNPIANNSSYRGGSVTGDNTDVTFSVDGKNFAAADALTVKDDSGKTWQAKPEDYRAIRWVYNQPLKPGEVGKVTYKTTINKP